MHTTLPPACPASGASLKTQRTLRFCFLPNRNGRFDKAIGPSGVLQSVYVSHRNNNGCFFESSVPIRKRLCGLRDLRFKTNKHLKSTSIMRAVYNAVDLVKEALPESSVFPKQTVKCPFF